MKQLISNVFYAFGIVATGSLYRLDPETAQLKDILSALHADVFWYAVAGVALLLTLLLRNGPSVAFLSAAPHNSIHNGFGCKREEALPASLAKYD